MLYNMLYIPVYNKTVNVMQHKLYNIYYITSNSRLYNKGGSCYVAICLLYISKLEIMLYSTSQPSRCSEPESSLLPGAPCPPHGLNR